MESFVLAKLNRRDRAILADKNIPFSSTLRPWFQMDRISFFDNPVSERSFSRVTIDGNVSVSENVAEAGSKAEEDSFSRGTHTYQDEKADLNEKHQPKF